MLIKYGTDKLSLEQLERIADQFAQVIAAAPEPPAAPRKKIAETKEALRARVQHLERTVEAQKVRIEQLEGELTTLKEVHAREGYNRIVRERERQRKE